MIFGVCAYLSNFNDRLLIPSTFRNDRTPSAMTSSASTSGTDVQVFSQIDPTCTSVKQQLTVTREDRNGYEARTKLQAACPLWHELRKGRLTASNFGKIIKRNSNNSSKGLLNSLLHPSIGRNPPDPIKWGLHHEDIACEVYRTFCVESGKTTLTIHRAGIFIDLTHGWLAASPDHLVIDPSCDNPNGICEIKCPYTARGLSPENACRIIPQFCACLNNGKVELWRVHNYYYQVQGQMAIPGRNWCDFII